MLYALSNLYIKNTKIFTDSAKRHLQPFCLNAKRATHHIWQSPLSFLAGNPAVARHTSYGCSLHKSFKIRLASHAVRIISVCKCKRLGLHLIYERHFKISWSLVYGYKIDGLVCYKWHSLDACYNGNGSDFYIHYPVISALSYYYQMVYKRYFLSLPVSIHVIWLGQLGQDVRLCSKVFTLLN